MNKMTWIEKKKEKVIDIQRKLNLADLRETWDQFKWWFIWVFILYYYLMCVQ